MLEIKNTQSYSYWSLFLLFLKFGFFAWGGPVAQIAMIKEELVDKQAWISPEKFKRVLALYQALPGPEAHELCVYFGMVHKKRLGGILAGLGFMLPGFMIMLLLSWMYQLYGGDVLLPLFTGVAPAVSALIIFSTYRLGTHIASNFLLKMVALLSVLLTFFKIYFLWVFGICVLFYIMVKKGYIFRAIIFVSCISIVLLLINIFVSIENKSPFFPQTYLFIEGLKAGLLSFGGAYTAIPFLKNNMVDIYPYITSQVFFDSIALANMIPAPLIIFATHLGFMTQGMTGAILMTCGVFLPAFSFTLLGHNYLERLVQNSFFHNILDAISAAVVGILIVTAWDIFHHIIIDKISLGLFIFALGGFFYFKNKWKTPIMIFFCGILYHVFI